MNTPPKFLKPVLLLLVAAGVAAWAWKTFRPETSSGSQSAPPVSAQAPANEPDHCVVVTYFNDDHPCPTCLKIEKLARIAVESGDFAEQLANGQLRFQTLNMDRPENKHFIDEYGLSFKTVVISERENGKQTKWEKYDEVWDLVGTPAEFDAYIKGGVRKHLESAIPKTAKPEIKTTDNPFSDDA